MSNDGIPEEFKDLLLGRTDQDDVDYQHYRAPCYSMAWDKRKSCWSVKVDGKKMLDLTASDFPEDVDLSSYEFVDHILRILRESGPDGLTTHIEELKCAS
mgnify:CR=1 FL=1